MINLLPPTMRKDMSYARKNSILLKWSTTFALAILGAGLIIASGMIYLTETTKNFEKRSETAQLALKEQKIEETQKQVEEMSSNIKLATDVLSREILFSKVLRQLGAVLPAETSLQQLQIDDLKGGLTLSARSKDIPAATQIQLNLEDPNNQIFEKADIENINCEAAGTSTATSQDQSETNNQYPCVVQIRALFMKDNPFSYIAPNSKEVKQ